MHKRNLSSFQKFFLFFIILILPVFIITEYRILKSKKQVCFYTGEDFYQTHPKDIDNKHFVIVIQSLSNQDDVLATLHSIADQDYGDYEVKIITNDFSDTNSKCMQEFAKTSLQEVRVDFRNMGSANGVIKEYYDTVHSCLDSDVIVQVNGGDWFAHESVLTKLNEVYANQEVWLTYSQFLSYPSLKKEGDRINPKKLQAKKKIHNGAWIEAPFKTYYASLFKEINIERTLLQEYMLSIEKLKVFLRPLVELGNRHVLFIPEVLIIHPKNSSRSLGMSITSLKEILKPPYKIKEGMHMSHAIHAYKKGCMHSSILSKRSEKSSFDAIALKSWFDAIKTQTQ